MSYDKLTEKVRQAEQALEARERTMAANWRVTKDTWKEAWTPGRIASIGVISGFMYGWRRKRAGGDRGDGMIRMASSMIALFSSLQAKSAAHDAEGVAQSAEQKAGGGGATPADAGNAATGLPDTRIAREPHWHSPPTAAAAATEISEP